MNNYEIIKECKIIHEYINDIITNSEQELDDISFKNIKTTLDIFDKMYSHVYEKTKEKEPEQLKINCPCPHCNNNVNISDVIDYAYVCEDCDENYYLGEGDLGFAWWEEDFDPVLLKNDFYLQLSFDVKEGNVIIGTESSSGAEYNCKTTKDLRNAIESYACNYLDYEEEHEYSIQIWETEEDRDRGESFFDLETFETLNDAIAEARRLYNKNSYACVEVVDDSDAYYNQDNMSEDFYIKGETISKVSQELFDEYLDKWTDHEDLPFSNDKLYCETKKGYAAIDNSSGNCWTENFETEKETFDWLLGLDLEMEGDDNELCW